MMVFLTIVHCVFLYVGVQLKIKSEIQVVQMEKLHSEKI